MTYTCTELDDADRDRWNDLVRNAPHGTPFHLYEALDVFARHSNTTAHPLVVRKGEEPIGLFPVFHRRIGPVTAVFSPPPALKIEYMGPVLVETPDMKVRRRERNLSELIDRALEWIDDRLGPRYVHVRTGTAFSDPRPFDWRDWDVVPRHTYLVDLTRGEDDLFMAFSSDARSNVRDADDHDVRLYEGDAASIESSIELVEQRHREQGLEYPLTAEFVTALYDALPDGVMRPYACEFEGEYVAGRIVLELSNTQYVWAGTADRDVEIDANDVIEWYAMRDGMDRGVERYDLMGGNTEKISSYKAKFAPDLARYYRLERASKPTQIAARAYQAYR